MGSRRQEMPLRISRLWLSHVVLDLPVDLRSEATTLLRAYALGLLELERAYTLVRGLLSSDGALVLDAPRRRLLVSDHPRIHHQVAAALRQLSAS